MDRRQEPPKVIFPIGLERFLYPNLSSIFRSSWSVTDTHNMVHKGRKKPSTPASWPQNPAGAREPFVSWASRVGIFSGRPKDGLEGSYF